ncbi:MAG: ribosome maturation factor RimP [Actinomycetota bacterium]|nr:ribosome maturation factor RimP [Actinomycetota bacterium]
MANVQEQLWDRIDPYVAAEGIELDDIEILGGGQIVRVTIDAKEPLGIDLIAEISKGIGRLIEDDDPFTSSYTLEVSTPGLERRLKRVSHYAKSIGREVKLKTFAYVDGEKRHEGVLVSADEGGFTVDVDGSERKFRYKDVSSARTVFVWEKSPRPGKDA